jgi:hypothetical protein
MNTFSPAASVTSTPEVVSIVPSKPRPRNIDNPRRAYSISENDDEIGSPPASISRLPRAGWQNIHRQSLLLAEEGNVHVKDQSPVRLPRVGQAPRREFSFSNLAEQYQAQEKISHPKKGSAHFEFGDEPESLPQEPVPIKLTRATQHVVDLFADDAPAAVEEVTPRAPRSNKPFQPAVEPEIIFHDADTTPKKLVKPSIGGGTGGRLPEETIFIEAEEPETIIQPNRSPGMRRDQKPHFSFGDQDPMTPAPKGKTNPIYQHFSIEGTPDPNAYEHRQRALQKKEVNHFRPDTIPHFDFVDRPAQPPSPKKENTEGMNKLLNAMGRSWMLGTDSPSQKEHGAPKKGLTPHFTFGQNGEEKCEEEKENGQSGHSKR